MAANASNDSANRVTAIVFFAIALTSLGAPQVLLTAAGGAYLLTSHGVGALPYVYIGAVAVAAPLAFAVRQLGLRVPPTTQMLIVTGVRALVAAGFFVAILVGETEYIGFAASLWARVDLILGLMVLWRLADKTFTGQGDQKWKFWIAACEPASSFAMGLFGALVVGAAGVGGMFALAALSLAAAIPPTLIVGADLAQREDGEVWRRRRRVQAGTRPLSRGMKSYLFYVTAAMVIWTGAHFTLETLLYGLVGSTFDTLEDRFRYLSYALGVAGLLGVAFTALSRREVLRNIGIRLLLIILPIILTVLMILGLAATALFEAPVALLAAVTVMKVIEYAFVSGFYTRAWRSLLGPFPETHRNRLINSVARNVRVLGTLAGSAVLLVIFATHGFDLMTIGVANVALSVLGLLISIQVQRSFLGVLERALSRRQTIDELDIGGSDRSSREIIQKMLREGDAKNAIDAARLHAALDVDGFVHMAPRMIAKGDRAVVRTLLDTVREIARPELYPPMAGRLTVEEDPGLRDALLTAAAATGHPRSPRLLAKSLADSPDDPPLGALIGLGRHGGEYGVAVSRQFLERYALKGDAELLRALEAARAIGPNAPTGPVAMGLRSEDPLLRRKAIRAAGRIGDPALANLLVDQLADRREWRAATLALAAMGGGAVEALARTIGDRTLPFKQRAAALRALGDIYEPEAREQLFLHASSQNRALRAHAHLALWRSGAVAPREKSAEFLEHARSEFLSAAEATLAVHDMAALETPTLDAALRQRAQRALVCAIRASGLTRHRSHDIEVKLSAIFGLSRDWRQVEAGLNLLPEELRGLFRKIANPAQPGAIDDIRAFAGQVARTPEDWLGHILSDAPWRTDWLRALAYHQLKLMRPDESETLTRLADRAGPYLQMVIDAEAKRNDGGQEMALNVVEKVLILKSADLFANVPDEDLAEIAPYLTPVYLDPDETIIREGDMGNELYIVVSGQVKFERDGVELARRGERTVFGDLAALDPEPRNATVTAVTPTQVMSLSNEHLLALFESNVEIASGVISSLIRRLRASDY